MPPISASWFPIKVDSGIFGISDRINCEASAKSFPGNPSSAMSPRIKNASKFSFRIVCRMLRVAVILFVLLPKWISEEKATCESGLVGGLLIVVIFGADEGCVFI